MDTSAKSKCVFIACSILAVTTIASGDTLYLKNGMYIVVTRATEKDGQIEYWVGSTKYTISKTLVSKIGSENGPSTSARGGRTQAKRSLLDRFA